MMTVVTDKAGVDSAECPYCGLHHGSRCPSVKAIEYHPDGTVKRVEFLTGADYPPNYGFGNYVIGGWDGRTIA